MSLLKRGNIWWSYIWINGIRHQQSTNTSNRKQAEAIEQKLKAEANARRHGLIEVDYELTFGELAARFMISGAMRPYVPDRLKQLLPHFADIPITRITKSTAREFRQYRKEHGVGDATINRDVATLRHLLYWAVDESLLLTNPLTRMRLERERRVQRPVMSYPEELKVLAAAPDHLRRLIIAALDTGMRRGEILHQLWEHVDLPRRLLSVTRSKTPEGEAREIPLSNRLTALLTEVQQPKGPVFTYQKAAIITNFDSSWQRAVRISEIRHFRFHDLRHSFNTRLMEAGVMQEVRKALMGHTSGDRVHSMYTHVELPIKRQAIDRLEAWVNQQQLQREKEQNDASTESKRTEDAGPPEVRGPEAVEEEVAS